MIHHIVFKNSLVFHLVRWKAKAVSKSFASNSGYNMFGLCVNAGRGHNLMFALEDFRLLCYDVFVIILHPECMHVWNRFLIFSG